MVGGMMLGVAIATVAFAVDTPDAWITTKAKIALLTTEGVHATSVNVDTLDGRVTLHGKVQSADEKAKAEEAVRNISGVKDVRDLLAIVPEANQQTVSDKDDVVKDRVTQALQNDASLKQSSITVQSVNQGVVLLSGKAATLSDHLHAVQVATQVPGVKRVASEIQSPDKLADSEIYQDTDKQNAKAVSSTVGDAWITSAAKLRLIADSRTPSMDINVDTRNAAVTLFGIVPTSDAKQAAEEDARKVSGVTNVQNELQVVPSQNRSAVDARDDDIEKAVKRAIDARGDLRSLGIGVEVKNGVVRLSGTVPSQGQRLAAAVTARGATGVRSVRDDLEVTGTD
jgi:osmotically-inducible protein OsmY